MNIEELLDKLRKMLFTTMQANECGLSNNDFKEDIQVLSETIGLLEKQDKIINIMAKMINNHDIDEDICSQFGKSKNNTSSIIMLDYKESHYN